MSIALVVSLLLLYIVLLIIALRLDAHDQQKGAIVNIIDNSPNYSQKYILTVETGFRKAAGTTAKVSQRFQRVKRETTLGAVSQAYVAHLESSDRNKEMIMLRKNLLWLSFWEKTAVEY